MNKWGLFLSDGASLVMSGGACGVVVDLLLHLFGASVLFWQYYIWLLEVRLIWTNDAFFLALEDNLF